MHECVDLVHVHRGAATCPGRRKQVVDGSFLSSRTTRAALAILGCLLLSHALLLLLFHLALRTQPQPFRMRK